MRIPNRLTRLVGALTVTLALIACAASGFNERLAGGYSTVAYTRDAAGLLLDAGKVTPAEAQALQGQADALRGGLDIAREVATYDLSTAEGKLAATLAAIAELRAELVSRGATIPEGTP